MSSPKLRVIFRPKSEFQTFFSPKIRCSQKKKKKRVFTKIGSDFSAEIGNSNVFFDQNQVVSKKIKKKKVFTKIGSDFSGRNRKFKRFFRPKSGGLQKKKKKKVFTKIGSDFSPEIVRLRLVGGDASRYGAELFEIEPDFLAEIVTFRLVGGDASPSPPPKSATGHGVWGRSPSRWAIFRNFLNKKAVLTPLDHNSHVFRASFENTRFFTFESQLKKIK